MISGTQASPILGTLGTSHGPLTPTFSPSLSPAPIYPLWEKVQELKGRIAGFGLKRYALLGRFDPDTLSLKTAQLSLFEDLGEYLQDLPNSGIMQNGRVYAALSSVSSSNVNGFIVLPTPLKTDSSGSTRSRYFGVSRQGGVGIQCRSYFRDGEKDGIYPNPELLEALMTFPICYTDLNVLEMQLCP